MGQTSIEWTDHSVNPLRARLNGRVGHYCEKVSPGCKNCYSSRTQCRFGMPPFQDQRGNPDVEHFLDVSKLEEVLRRRIPTKWFWCDMTDLFGSWVPFEWIAACFGVMAATPHHTHQVLTKRPDRALEFFRWLETSPVSLGGATVNAARGARWYAWSHIDKLKVFDEAQPWIWPLPNVWLGVSVEDQQRAEERLPLLEQCPAAVRFVSYEPALGPVDFSPWLRGTTRVHMCADIAGMLRNKSYFGCAEAGTAFFFKQKGSLWYDLKRQEGIRGSVVLPVEADWKWLKLDPEDTKSGDWEQWAPELRTREFPQARGA